MKIVVDDIPVIAQTRVIVQVPEDTQADEIDTLISAAVAAGEYEPTGSVETDGQVDTVRLQRLTDAGHIWRRTGP